MIVLGVETSCDETSAAVVEGGCRVLSNIVASQAELHARWGGVVPEVASRKHVERVLPVIEEALEAAGATLSDIGGIAVTNRPGLVGALVVGVAAAKALGYALGKPVVGVHHLEGHLASARLAEPALELPFVCLLASGGHTEILLATKAGIQMIGRTLDDAAGECFDKCARLLGLPYPGGPEIDRLAASGNAAAVRFPRAKLPGPFDFSFSGLKTAVLRFLEKDREATPTEDIAASLQAAITGVLTEKTLLAAETQGVRWVAVAGGVAANRGLKAAFETAALRRKLSLAIPPPDLCTDNAAMIAAAGHDRLAAGESDMPFLDCFATAPLTALTPV